MRIRPRPRQLTNDNHERLDRTFARRGRCSHRARGLDRGGRCAVPRDGGRLSLRQIGHADRDGLATLFARLSPESRHRRFLPPKRELTPRELAFFTDIDHVHYKAIAAVDQRDGSIVGIVRDVQHPDRAGVADVAIEVADAFHRMGIGTYFGYVNPGQQALARVRRSDS
jgi:hypothetical protein